MTSEERMQAIEEIERKAHHWRRTRSPFAEPHPRHVVPEDVLALIAAVRKRDARISVLGHRLSVVIDEHKDDVADLLERNAKLRSALEPFAVEDGDEQEQNAARVLGETECPEIDREAVAAYDAVFHKDEE